MRRSMDQHKAIFLGIEDMTITHVILRLNVYSEAPVWRQADHFTTYSEIKESEGYNASFTRGLSS